MSSQVSGAQLDYRQVRRRHCITALIRLARRWGIYVGVAAALAGSAAPAIAASVVTPLFWASSHSWWAALAVPAYAVAAGMMMWSMRSLMWPVQWDEVERQLPIRPRHVLLSDLEIATIAFLPLGLMTGAGATILLMSPPLWLRNSTPAAVASLLTVWWGSIAFVVWKLKRRRMQVSSVARTIAERLPSAGVLGKDWPSMLFAAPIARGAAPRLTRTLVWAMLALPLTAVMAAGKWISVTPALMIFSALALVAVAALGYHITQELKPIHDLCRPLPVDQTMLARMRSALSLLPAVLGLAMWAPILFFADVRPAVLAAYFCITSLGWIWHTVSTASQPATVAIRWLALLILGLTLASEVVR